MKPTPRTSLQKTALAVATLLIGSTLPKAAADPVDDRWKADVLGGVWQSQTNWVNAQVPDDWGNAIFTPAVGATTRSIITLDQDVYLNSIVMDGYQAGVHDPETAGWTISGPAALNFQSPSSTAGIIDFSSYYGNTLAGSIYTIESAVVANQGLHIWGNNSGSTSRAVLDWRAASTTTPLGITLFRASLDVEAVAGSLGAGAIRFAADAVNRISLSNANPTSWPEPNVDGVFSNNLILENSISELMANYYDNGRIWNINITGTISEAGRQTMNFLSSSSGNGGVRYVVSGENTYTGDTNVGGANTGPTIARATTNAAFGLGTANIQLGYDRDTVELANNVTISDKILRMTGGGYQGAGALNSISGQNEWAGNIELGGVVDNRIGAASESSLTISGVISGDRLLRKTGLGSVILTRDNTFSQGLMIDSGSVVAASTGALGTGNVSLSEDGGLARLAIAAGVEAEIAENLLLGSGSILAFDLSGRFENNETLLTVFGNQTGAGSYTVELLRAEGLTSGIFPLMTIEGSFEASQFLLSAPGLQGSLIWSEGTLSYNAQAIPEPGAVLLVLLGAAALAFRSRRAAKV